ncbi:circadian clock KaiB family protein [Bradyrhizobium guangzhouense]|uniref:Circadian clock protein KaiB n=1 Tax=Bradyrhizobium guangzhouense TaxID=1325095 RepID=A0AAE5X0W7_9BRAD|nr:circadian clock KaiB family protein [Bradyrhizobium guangzhouense]QAU46802.1 circadian clock protein KaiB [Bradyrhizobium guangzhouense]RXH09060.1 circadian clock protein KaiB [Bradyrhizobium guangzhouense]RXH14402.1 circadian clock protein KaiB [Bradyrhizobium guangzhouense]
MAARLLRLYVAGNSASSRRAQQNLERLRVSLGSRGWDVETVDVLERPELAESARIIATPTLSYEDGARTRRIVGDLSDTARVLEFLGINEKDEA